MAVVRGVRPGTEMAVLVAVAVLPAFGCPAARPTLTVRVQSGLRAGLEIGYVDARLVRGSSPCAGDPAAVGSAGVALTRADQRALGEGTLTVAELSSLEPGIYTVRARFRRPPDDARLSADSGPVLVERCLVTTLTSSRVVRIALTTDCLGLTCPRAGGDATHTECLNGRCVDPGCDPDDAATAELCCDDTASGPGCDPSVTLCDADLDCAASLPCASARGCHDGVCVEPESDACPPGSYCSATDRDCVLVERTIEMDAGMPDAASPPDDASLLDAIDVPDSLPPPGDAFVGTDVSMDVTVRPDAFAGTDAAVDAYVGPDAFVCGGTGQPCCASSACTGSRVCVSGTCRACGSTGQPCCAGSACSGSLVCSGGMCVGCGGVGQPCCGGSACGGGSVCSGGSCVACGAVGQRCCAGSSCADGATCAGATCVACGGFLQPCCGSVCGGGLGCDGGTCTCRSYAEDCSAIPCCSGYLCGGSSGGGCCATRDLPCNLADGSVFCCGTDWCCDVGGGEGRCRPQFSC